MKSKTLTVLLLLAFFTNCKKEKNNNNYIKGIELVYISKPSFSQTLITQSLIRIQAFASAGSGCYSNFNFKFNKINDFNYTLKAYATFETNGACPTVMTGKDTIINFIPEKKGVYIFKTNDSPFEVRSDTIVVN